MMTMESVKVRSPRRSSSGSKYRRMEPELEEEMDEAEWSRRAAAGSLGRRRAGRYVFTCALFASLNAILLGYGQRQFSSLSPKRMEWNSSLRMSGFEMLNATEAWP
ncbi:hypothetical protein BRADI_5g16485v3 [Brachypodium distachyon]|uniref:Uncharacterized protein n=1 Tax=Brachypodium distachyon TaxID=15368 RepID=A0A2K2CHM6_BRADI|nr:hypothetical protein BRADI_5g16485v3 [Brachypodium distachyon]